MVVDGFVTGIVKAYIKLILQMPPLESMRGTIGSP